MSTTIINIDQTYKLLFIQKDAATDYGVEFISGKDIIHVIANDSAFNKVEFILTGGRRTTLYLKNCNNSAYNVGTATSYNDFLVAIKPILGPATFTVLPTVAAYNAVSADTTLDSSYGYVAVSASGAARTITLPAAASNSNQRYTIVKTDATVNAVTVDANASETIDGLTTWILGGQWDYVTIWSDGTNWLVESSKTGSVTSVSADTTISFAHQSVNITTSTTNRTMTLPTAVGCKGRIYRFTKVDESTANAIIDGNGAETINGAANYTLYHQYESVTLQSNGVGWDVLAAYVPRFHTALSGAALAITLTARHDVILGSTAGAGRTVTLPAVAAVPVGKRFTFVKMDAPAEAITIEGDGAETINGAANFADIDAQYDSATLENTGTEWVIIAKSIA